ncbi:MAG: sulfurtransferase-like selenium metabolism protein YedF [Desulfuromonadaceae bacterium]|nr:sulfurtransferase-like selenium metabolism protein YedF [Desulfuromonadaceae bacterium]
MMKELDCRGMNCPAPVLHVRDTLAKEVSIDIAVLVDNEAARQNVSRFLEHQSYQVQTEPQEGGFRVVGTRGEGAYVPPAASPTQEVIRPGTGKKIMVLVTSGHMGHGDDALGDMLMFNFIKTLKEMGSDLWCVAFVNSGVSFTSKGSEAVPLLQELVENGVQILACGACLAYFHILDKMQVGEVTNMLDIVTGMKRADSVITV